MKKTIATATLLLGYATLASGTIMNIANLLTNTQIPTYLYIAGVALIAIYRILTVKRDGDFRIKRLNTLEATSTLLLIASAYCLYIAKNVWVLLLLLALAIDIIITFRYPRNPEKQ